MRTGIWLVRHGQTQHAREHRYQGACDGPLTAYGERQAAALGVRLRRLPFSLAIVSPSDRARATAAAVLGERKTAIVEDARWAEMHHGRWEGLTYAEVRERFPGEAAARFAAGIHGRAQGGESLADVDERVRDAWREIASRYRGERILIVTHATPIQLVLCAIAGLPPEAHWRWRADLGSLTAIDLYAAGPIVRVVNEQPRLAQPRS